jgi:hypothetical protein
MRLTAAVRGRQKPRLLPADSELPAPVDPPAYVRRANVTLLSAWTVIAYRE